MGSTQADVAPDVVHVVNPVILGLWGTMVARQRDLPLLASYHTDITQYAHHLRLPFLIPISRVFLRDVHNQAHVNLCTSQPMVDKAEGLGIRRVRLWPKAVDTDLFHPDRRDGAMRERLSDGHPDAPLMLYVGRLSNEKQLDQVRPVLTTVPGTRLAVVGDGPARQDLAQHFAGTPTKFMGYLRDQELWSAFASADIFVFPSAMETFGLVLIEAMASGLPVVTTRVGGVDDMVQPGVNGYVFNVGDVRGMIDGVRAILSHPAKRMVMGRNARLFAETQAWPAMMDELITCYDDLITGRTPRI